MVLGAMIDKPQRIRDVKKGILRRRTDRFESVITVHVPVWFLTKYEIGYDLNDNQKITLNKFFEEKFEEELVFFCKILGICGVETKDAMEEFCRNFNIEIGQGDDITMDALLKKEYRFRKKLEENPAELSGEKPSIQPTLLFGKTA